MEHELGPRRTGAPVAKAAERSPGELGCAATETATEAKVSPARKPMRNAAVEPQEQHLEAEGRAL